MEQTIYKFMADERKKIFFLTEEEGKRKKKNSFEPDSNQRPKDAFITSTVLRSTNWAIEGTLESGEANLRTHSKGP